MSSSDPDTPSTSSDRADACPLCGLTRAQLHQHGLMGCATCYQVFEDLVEQATAELHGAKFSQAPPLTPPRNTTGGSSPPSSPVSMDATRADRPG